MIFSGSNYSIRCIFLCIVLSGLLAGYGLAADSTLQESIIPKEEKRPEVRKKPDIFIDGVYIGISEGWTGMEIEVTVLKGQIAGIKALKINGTPEFYQKVVKVLPDRIIKESSADVDGISGATLSSNSMKEAVSHALKKAKQIE